jgi:hypothetical protein
MLSFSIFFLACTSRLETAGSLSAYRVGHAWKLKSDEVENFGDGCRANRARPSISSYCSSSGTRPFCPAINLESTGRRLVAEGVVQAIAVHVTHR